MDTTHHRIDTGSRHDWTRPIKDEAYRRIADSPLVQGCASRGNEANHVVALLAGFWPFVDAFPGIIRHTYGQAFGATPDEALRRFQRRTGAVVSAAMAGMASDESTHRALWLVSARSIGLSEDDLGRPPVLPAIRHLIDAVGGEPNLGRRLLYFVAVEIVAEGVSRLLSQSPRFVAEMGEHGMDWFAAHRLAPGRTGAHEALAYKLALALKRALNEPADVGTVGEDVRRCIDWFVAAGAASVDAFCEPATPAQRRKGG